MKSLKHYFLWWLIFSWTVIISFIWFAAYSSLPNQLDWATITKDIWNNVIDRINLLWTDIDSVKSSYSQLWVWQTRQNVTASRVNWTTYTNSTWKPIVVVPKVIQPASWQCWVHIYIDWMLIYSVKNEFTSLNNRYESLSAIIPNTSTYRIEVDGWSLSSWYELR